MPKPPPLSMEELLALPVSVGLREVCRALDISESTAYELLAAGKFPIEGRRYSPGRNAERHFSRADLFRHLGLDPFAVAAPAPGQSGTEAA